MDVVSAWYRIINDSPVIFLRLKNNRGKKIAGFKPYCYVPKSRAEVAVRLARAVEPGVRVEKTDYVTFPNKVVGVEPAVRLVFNIPKNVARARSKNEYIFYEADIPFVYRYMIDADLVPVAEYEVAYIDIEVDDSHGFPNVEEARRSILSIAVVDQNGKRRWFYAADYAGAADTAEFLSLPEKRRMEAELEMITDFLEYVHRYELLAGWNIERFDYPYLRNRYKLIAELLGAKKVAWEYWQWFDLQQAYKAIIARSIESFALEYVAEYEDLPVRKVVRSSIVSDLKRDELEEYNMTDAEILYHLDKKLTITKVFAEIGRYTGTFPSDATARSRAIDYLLLRRLRGRGVVLPSKIRSKEAEEEEGPGYKGAIVFPPPPRGVYSLVGVIDFSGMYPSIIRQFAISPDVKHGLVPEGKKPIYKEILDELAELRKKYKKLRNKYDPGTPEYEKYDAIQLAYKILMNAFYGVLGYKSFRLYDKELAETVTSKGRELITSVAEYLEKKYGLTPLYGDTDSVFLWLRRLYDLRGEAEERVAAELCYGPAGPGELSERTGLPRETVEEALEAMIRRGVVVAAGGKYSLNPPAHELLEKLAADATGYVQGRYKSTILVVDAKTVYSRLYFAGVKKRYAGFVAWEEGKFFQPNTRIDTKGFESKRSDWPPYIKNYQKELFKLLLSYAGDEEILSYSRRIVERLQRRQVPVEELIIGKGISKGFEEYKSNTPHIRAARILYEAGLPVAVGDKIWFIWVRLGRLDVLPVDPRSRLIVVPATYARKMKIVSHAPNKEYVLVEPDSVRRVINISKYVDLVKNVFVRVTGLNPRLLFTKTKSLLSYVN